MRRAMSIALLCAFVAAPALADFSFQTQPILGTGGSSVTGDLVMITGPTPTTSGGDYYYDVDGNVVLGPTIPHYSISGDPLEGVGSPSMSVFYMNADTWSDTWGTYIDPDLEIHAGSGVYLDAGQVYTYEGLFTYVGPNASYSVQSAYNATYTAPASFIMLHSSLVDLWLEDEGSWTYTETWKNNATGATITSLTRDFEVVQVPVPGAVLLGLLGLAAAGRKLRKHA